MFFVFLDHRYLIAQVIIKAVVDSLSDRFEFFYLLKVVGLVRNERCWQNRMLCSEVQITLSRWEHLRQRATLHLQRGCISKEGNISSSLKAHWLNYALSDTNQSVILVCRGDDTRSALISRWARTIAARRAERHSSRCSRTCRAFPKTDKASPVPSAGFASNASSSSSVSSRPQ